MAAIDAIGFVAMTIGLLGAVALVSAGLLSLVRPLNDMASRLLIFSNVCGALAVIAGLGVFMVTVVWLGGRDDVGLIGSALIAYFIGAGVGAPVFLAREFLRKGTHGSGTTRVKEACGTKVPSIGSWLYGALRVQRWPSMPQEP